VKTIWQYGSLKTLFKKTIHFITKDHSPTFGFSRDFHLSVHPVIWHKEHFASIQALSNVGWP
jgi:hypothetical protein